MFAVSKVLTLDNKNKKAVFVLYCAHLFVPLTFGRSEVTPRSWTG